MQAQLPQQPITKPTTIPKAIAVLIAGTVSISVIPGFAGFGIVYIGGCVVYFTLLEPAIVNKKLADQCTTRDNIIKQQTADVTKAWLDCRKSLDDNEKLRNSLKSHEFLTEKLQLENNTLKAENSQLRSEKEDYIGNIVLKQQENIVLQNHFSELQVQTNKLQEENKQLNDRIDVLQKDNDELKASVKFLIASFQTLSDQFSKNVGEEKASK